MQDRSVRVNRELAARRNAQHERDAADFRAARAHLAAGPAAVVPNPSRSRFTPLACRVTGTACVAIAADQLTKLVAIATSRGSHSGAIVPVHNPDFSLGIASASLPVMVLIAGLGIVAIGVMAMRRARAGRLPAWVPGLLIGGAVSNLADRLVFGAVHDFLATPCIVFNLADVAVVAGVAGLALSTLTKSPKEVTP
jgi:signal peptidase II